MNLEENIIKIFKDFDSLPVMFVGAGLSMRYINGQSWEPLLKSIAQQLDTGETRPYHLAYNKAKSSFESHDDAYNGNSILPLVATHLGESYNNYFNSNINFQPLLQDHFETLSLEDSNISPFKIAIANECIGPYSYTETYYDEKESFSKIDNKIAHFVTTNYDTLLEDVFHSRSIIIGQENILSKRQAIIGDMYKIHGCVSQPNTIVIDDNDYKHFERRKKYLSSKLLTLFLEHPVIFIGYGMNDSNIKSILNDIKLCINPHQYDSFKDHWFFVDFIPDHSSESESISTSVIEGLTITRLALNNYNTLYNAIATIKTKFTVEHLRGIEDLIVDLIQTSDDQREGIHTTGLNNEGLHPNDIAVVIGSSASVFNLGMTGLRLIDICKDVLFETLHYNSKDLVESTILGQKNYFSSSKIPLHSYIPSLPDGYVLNTFFDNKIISEPLGIYNKVERKKVEKKKQDVNIDELILNSDLENSVKNIYFNLPVLNLKDVEEYMKKNWKELSKLKQKTYITKIVCYIDYVRNNKKTNTH